MKLKLAKRLFAAGLTLALAVGLLGTSALASGTVNDVKEKTGDDGSIVVTVYDQAPGTAGTGAPIDSGLSNPVDGVGINALRIGDVVELTSTDSQGVVSTQVAFGLTKTYTTLLGLDTQTAIAQQGSTYYFTPSAVQTALENAEQTDIEEYLDNDANGAATKVTGELAGDDDKGVATFDGLTYGLYLLAKSSLPANATTDLVPFLVSVPMYVESDAGDGWQSTVYAYPKVRTGDITTSKTVNDDDKYVNAGQTLTYTVTTTIPAVDVSNGSATPFTSFVITDTNTGKTLNVTTSSIAVNLGNAVLTGVDKTTYETKTDEEKATYDYYYTYADDGNSVLTITVTDTGLGKINAGLTNAQNVVVTYQATVATDVAFSTKLTNTAKATYHRSGMTEPADTPESEVNLYTYGLDLTKTLSVGTDTIGNQEISFALYTDAACTEVSKIPVVSGTNGYWVADGEEAPPVVMYIAAGANSGKLNLYGLEPGTYYLKELTTKTGYTLLDAPITIVITAPQTTGEEATATVNTAATQVTGGVVPLSVENTKNETGFHLPQTGGAGTLAVTAIGLGLLCAGVILLVVYRRKGQKDA